jgi:hypothetical protein
MADTSILYSLPSDGAAISSFVKPIPFCEILPFTVQIMVDESMSILKLLAVIVTFWPGAGLSLDEVMSMLPAVAGIPWAIVRLGENKKVIKIKTKRNERFMSLF